jgi:peptidoglycan/LPS O-acetylase OafA/YrhL
MDMTISELLLRSLIMGIIATMTFDLWAVVLQRTLGTPAPDWRLLGRWIYHTRTGQTMHDNIRLAAPFRYENAVGWLAHYTTGTLFAAALLIAAGPGWAHHPTLIPALVTGLATIGLIWCVLMPAFGHGFAASKSPIANRIRAINIVSHVILGVGLYGGARLANQLFATFGAAS